MECAGGGECFWARSQARLEKDIVRDCSCVGRLSHTGFPEFCQPLVRDSSHDVKSKGDMWATNPGGPTPIMI